MAYVSVPKDLNKVKSKIALNMTKRQLVCFGTATIIGVPIYLFSKATVGNAIAVLLMMAIMLPFFFIGMYEKDGQPAEKILRNYIRAKFYSSAIRPYKTVNLYKNLTSKEGISFDTKTTSKYKKAATTVRTKYSKGKITTWNNPKK